MILSNSSCTESFDVFSQFGDLVLRDIRTGFTDAFTDGLQLYGHRMNFTDTECSRFSHVSYR